MRYPCGEGNVFSGIMRTASANLVADPPDRACIEPAVAMRADRPVVGLALFDQNPGPQQALDLPIGKAA
ncbi:MAG: hypothetical protein AB7U34_11065 [Novosphingobium sp.]